MVRGGESEFSEKFWFWKPVKLEEQHYKTFFSAHQFFFSFCQPSSNFFFFMKLILFKIAGCYTPVSFLAIILVCEPWSFMIQWHFFQASKLYYLSCYHRTLVIIIFSNFFFFYTFLIFAPPNFYLSRFLFFQSSHIGLI